MKDLIQTGEAVDLAYDEKCEALAGRINGLSTAIKENEKTGTYGALMWVKRLDDPSGDRLSAFLQNEVALKPHIIKHYKIMGRGAAVALVKYNDPLRNINNIKRFMSELADGLRDRSYMNCCYKCGATQLLSIYNDNNVPVQYCPSCARGSLIVAFDREYASDNEPKRDRITFADTTETAAVRSGADTMRPASAENKIFEDDSMNALLADTTDENVESGDNTGERVISAAPDDPDISGFMIPEEQTDASAASGSEDSADEPDVREETEETVPSVPDHAFDALMFSGDEKEELTASWGENQAESEPEKTASDTADLGELMFDGDTAGGEELPGEESDVPGDDGGEDISGLMFGEETVQRAADVVRLSEGEKLVTEVTELTKIGGDDLKAQTSINDDEDEEGDEDVEVTEYHDDSNDGEDIDVTELESKINEPTDSSGGELKAEVTPLENDGSVPLINPALKTSHPSAVYEPNAVRAYVGGTYDNATASDEPVGFDGRRRGDELRGNPRGGDEFNERKKTGITSVSRPAKPSNPNKMPQNYSATVKPISYSYAGDSKPIVGGIAAFLFGLIGAALWAGSGYLFDLMKLGDETGSLMMSFLALLVALLTFVGYRIGGDCFDIKGIIISSVITVIIDVAGAAAVFVTSEFRWSQTNLSYSVPLNMAIERMMHGLSGSSDGPLIYGKLFVIGGVMLVSLLAAIFIAKKKS